MRLLVEFKIPTQSGNEAVRSGKIKGFFDNIMEEFKPEASYFLPDNGSRAGFLVIKTDDPSVDVAIGEAFWLGLQAEVKVTPCMNAEELGKGLAKMGKILEKYG